MRSIARNVAVAAILGTSALAYSGCEAKKQTEYVAGITTQVTVPRDLKTIRVDVSVGGVFVMCRAYKVYDGKVQLPRSLGSFSNNGNVGDPITFTILGFTEELENVEQGPARTDVCKQSTLADGVRILRRSRQPYVKDEVLFLPLALKYSCFDVECEDRAATGKEGGILTCKGGRCVDAAIDEKTLPRFSEDLVDGTGGNCFPASQCFAAQAPPVIVDEAKCIYAIPNTPSAPKAENFDDPFKIPGEGINVMISYDGGLNLEILDKEKDEGFTIPDPAKPQQFQLAPGLCEMVRGIDDAGNPTQLKHRISAIRVSPICRAKSPFQPLCKDDMFAAMGVDAQGISGQADQKCEAPQPLRPAQAALALLIDNSARHRVFFTGEDDLQGETGLALDTFLNNPQLENTYISLTYFPGATLTCSDEHKAEKEALPARLAKAGILASRDDLGKNTGKLVSEAVPLNLTDALTDTYASLDAKYPTANRRAVAVVGTRGFGDAACTPAKTPSEVAAEARNKGDYTYVALLARDANDPPMMPGPLPLEAFQLAQNGSPTGLPIDARKDKSQANELLKKLRNELATCAYDVKDAAAAAKLDKLTWVQPLEGTSVLINKNPACDSEFASSNVDGFGIDKTNKNRIRICGKSCTDYQTYLDKWTGYYLAYKQPPLPIPIVGHSAGCAPPKAAPSTGGGGGGGGNDAGMTGTPDAGAKDASASDGGFEAGVDAGL